MNFFLKYPQYLRVSVGDHNWKDEEFKFVTLSKILIHPNYSPDDYLYDVAILTLSERIEFSNKVSAICLPSGVGDYAGELGTVTGWGQVDVPFDEDNHHLDHTGTYLPHELQVANSSIISNEECQERPMFANWRNISESEICSMTPGSTCQGDSGGPIFIMESERFESIHI